VIDGNQHPRHTITVGKTFVPRQPWAARVKLKRDVHARRNHDVWSPDHSRAGLDVLSNQDWKHATVPDS